MKQLQTKKGFTLVELMIVVAVLGVLVGVAFPVYNSVTKHVKEQTCEAQQNIIHTTLNAYIDSANNGKRHTFYSVCKAFGMTTPPESVDGATAGPFAADAWPQEFLEFFDDKKAPLCPFDETKSTYTITFYYRQNDIPRWDVACTADHSEVVKAEK